MAIIVPVGQPANDAEKWAFNFLAKELPDHYTIITNVDVYSDHGQPFECDAIIVGDWAVYIVDVKGYQGRLSAGKDVWKHGDKTVDNPLPKLHQNARILASRCKLKLRKNQYAPWCQGMTFITGGIGGDIIISKGEDKLPVFNKDNIVRALTSADHVTAYHKNLLDENQRDIALSAICDFKLLREKENKVGGYVKKDHLATKNGVELWVVEPEEQAFHFQYWMKYIDISGLDKMLSHELTEQLKKEFYLLSELADLPSVPAALAFHNDGESIALVHQNIIGQPLSERSTFDIRQVMLDVADTLIEMSHRGIYHRALSSDNIYISDDGKVQLLNVGLARSITTKTVACNSQLESQWLPPEYIENGNYSEASLSYQFAHVFLPFISSAPPTSNSTFEFVNENYVLDPKSIKDEFSTVFDWLSLACNADESVRLGMIGFVESLSRNPKNLTEEDFSFTAGAKISGKYELIDCIGRGGTSSIWRASHLLGEYICCLKVIDTFDGAESLARKEFEVLRVLYHPNIVRIFDLDIIPNTNQYFLSCEYLEGDTLNQVEFGSIETGLDYFKQCLCALQYLHRLNRMHKDVKPENIVITGGKACLIDFNVSLLDSRLIGTTRYKDPAVKVCGWSKFSDIYSLVISFSEVITGLHPFVDNDEIPSVNILPVLSKGQLALPANVKSKFDQVLRREVNWEGIQDYCAWFGISDRIEINVSDNILSRWNINKGYMLKALTTMLADMQPRSRTVVIKNTLKSNGIVGNKSSKGSVSAAISALKANSVVIEQGTKILLTPEFLVDWERCQSN